MTIREAKAVARRWVARECACIADFFGAAVRGSVARADDKEDLGPYSDIDIRVYLENDRVCGINHPESPFSRHKYFVDDVCIEPLYETSLPQRITGDGRETVDLILSTPYLADEFSRADGSNILADPSGQLARLNRAVSKEYRKAVWVEKRLEQARSIFLQRCRLASSDEAGLAGYRRLQTVRVGWFALGALPALCGLPVLAALGGLTFRRGFHQCRALLTHHGYAARQEELLEYVGCATLDRETVNGWIDELSDTYGVAAECVRTPFFGDFDIDRRAERVIVGGCRDALECGDHRDGVPFLLTIRAWVQNALDNDGPPDAAEAASRRFNDVLRRLHLASGTDYEARAARAEAVAETMFNLSREIMRRRPGDGDVAHEMGAASPPRNSREPASAREPPLSTGPWSA